MMDIVNTRAYYKKEALMAMYLHEGDEWAKLYARNKLTALKLMDRIHARQVAVETTQVHESLALDATRSSFDKTDAKQERVTNPAPVTL